MLTDRTQQEIRAHAERCFPRECCGFICVRKGREHYLPCPNEAATPREHFKISAQSYAAAEEFGDIIGIVHSHPNTPPKPSVADKVQCEEWGLPWHIVHVSKYGADEIFSFEPSGFVAQLVGRPFTPGVLDCYTLIRDWYQRERGITLPNYEREDLWWERGQNLYLDHFEEAGFVEITGLPQTGDVVLMQLRAPVPNHAAVYIGYGQIMHHVQDRLSSRDVYGGYWQQITRKIVRYAGTKA